MMASLPTTLPGDCTSCRTLFNRPSALSSRAASRPDFKTIADFRRDNRAAFKPVFREFVLLCRQLDLFGRELITVDGTRLKAVNNKDRNFTRASLAAFIELADAKLDDYLQRLDQSDGAEAATSAPGSGSRRCRASAGRRAHPPARPSPSARPRRPRPP